MKTFDLSDKPSDARIAIVVSKFNESVTSRLLAGAVETLKESGVAEDNLLVAWTPGAFELPLAACRLAERDDVDAVICLGAVIRGETTHDQHINQSTSRQIARLSVSYGIPVMFGVLTCDSVEQALNRAGGGKGNKGSDCATAALEMVGLLRNLDGDEQAG